MWSREREEGVHTTLDPGQLCPTQAFGGLPTVGKGWGKEHIKAATFQLKLRSSYFPGFALGDSES